VKTLQIIKKIAIWTGSLLLVAVIGLYIVLRYYEDEVVAYAFEKSKDVFTRPVQINDIDLAFWHTFPNASLHLSEVYIPDSFHAKDTLLCASDVYLEFNLFDLFNAHYELLELEIDQATAKVKFNKAGEDNFHFWKASGDTSDFNVALEEVLLKDVRFVYRDEKARKELQLFTSKTIAKGDLSQEQCELNLQTESILKQWWSNDQTLWSDQALTCDAKIQVNYTEQMYQFQDASIGLGDLHAMINGVIHSKKDPYFDLTLTGDEIQLEQVFSLLPADLRQSMDQYQAKGEVQLAASYKGTYSKKSMPQLRVDLTMNDGSMQSPDGEVQLTQMAMQSIVQSAAEGWHIEIARCQANLAGGQIQLSGEINAADQTELDMAIQANAAASDLQHFFNLDTLEICSGEIKMELQSKGVLKWAAGDSLIDFTALQNTGQATWSNGEMKLKNSNRHFTGLQAAIQLDNANAHVKGFNGVVNGCDFSINGSFKNLVPFLIDDQQRLLIEANLYSQLMDFNQLLEVANGSEEAYELNLPKRVDFAFNSHIKKFVFRQFYADEMRCVANLREGRFFVDPLSFMTAGGQLSAQLSLQQTAQSTYYVNCLANIERMDISELFREFENFDQSFIQDRHLKGKANAMVQFQAPVSAALDVSYRDLYSVIDLKIADGQLIGLESLQEIATYIRSNKWIAPFVDEDQFAEKLRDIKFSTLENTIEIKDEVIAIPIMDIRSSAMDISISGKHQFNNEIFYSLGFNIRDILIRKQKDWQEQDDGLGKQIFVYMSGTTDNPQFGMDKEASRSDRKEELQQEKQNMKALLKEEFGLFKKDNQVGAFKEAQTPKETTTTIQWEDFDPPAQDDERSLAPDKRPKEKQSPPPADTKPKKTRKWLQEKE
jgi:hypothetical protein